MANTTDVVSAIRELTSTKQLERSELIDLLKDGLHAALVKRYGPNVRAEIGIDEMKGSIRIVVLKTVVEAVEDPGTQVSLEEARYEDPEFEPGDVLEEEVPFEQFGRTAVQAAKQRIIQRVREGERSRIREEFSGKVGELLSGEVQQIERGKIVVMLNKFREAEAIIPYRDQNHREHFHQGDTIRAVLKRIEETPKGPRLILSRADPLFVKALFKLEVPEIQQAIVEIRATAREAGSRTKIAVSSRDDSIDPVGACVGLKGSRVQAVVNELNGERLDIVPWSPDPERFAKLSLAPARVAREPLRVWGPRHDVDALAVQLVHDRLHARAFEAHARAHRVDGVVPGRDGDLGPAPRLAGGGADFHDALLDLRHLELEERLHKQRVGARQDQARALGRLLDALQHRADRVALMEVLAVILLAVGDDRLGFTEFREHHDDLPALDLLHLARKQLAHLVGELLADAGTLALTDALDDALLRGLHRRAAERFERHLLFQHVAHLEIRVLESRFLERHLRPRILHRLDHGAQHHDPDRALQLVDPDLRPHVRAVALHQRRVQTVLQQIEQLRALELLRVRQLADRGNYVACIRRHWILVTNPQPAGRP